MLTNPFETQMVRCLGVKIGGRAAPATPFEHLRTSIADPRADAFAGESTRDMPVRRDGERRRRRHAGGPVWTPEAEARIARIPAFIRPMARRAVERFAEAKGYPCVTEAVMDEARGAFGM